jgi:hypothetical protein
MNVMSEQKISKTNIFCNFMITIVAICALGTSIYQMVLTRKYFRMSLTPHLSFGYILRKDKDYYEVVLENKGVGPARITKFYINNEEYTSSKHNRFYKEIEKAISSFLRKDIQEERKFVVTGFDPGYFFEVNEKASIISIPKDNLVNDVNAIDLLKALDTIQFVMRYKDLYGNDIPPASCPYKL